jgi:hypothetical protein
MTIPRNLSFLAEGASSTGVLGTANGGTGLNTLGTAGQALVVNSGATGLTYSTPSAGAMTLISTQTGSGIISWTGLSGYKYYILLYSNVNASSTIVMQVGYGSTPTYLTSSYQSQASVIQNGTAIGLLYSAPQFFAIGAYNQYISTSYPAFGNVIIFPNNPSTYNYVGITGQSISYGGDYETNNFTGYNTSSLSSIMTAIKIGVNSSGAIAGFSNGEFSLYGITG